MSESSRGGIEHFDQFQAEAIDRLRDCQMFVLYTVNRNGIPQSISIVPDGEHVALYSFILGALLREAQMEIGSGPEIESCSVCGGVTEHVTGCPEMDKPR